MKKGMLVLSFFIVLSFSFVYSEDLTITTYYPSPYGSYNELRTNMLAVGSAYQDTTANPLTDGRMIVSNNISINSNTAGTYSGEAVRLDVNGYGAVNDLWLKVPKSGGSAGWVSQLISGVSIGSYIGNNVAGTKITLGFQPRALFVQRAGSSRMMKVEGMGTTMLGDDGGTNNNCVTSFASDGFILGTDGNCNNSSHTYYYIAFPD